MNLLLPKSLPLLLAAALLQCSAAARAEKVCDLGDARQFSAIAELCPFVDGLARIKIGNRWGFVDTSGKLAIAPQFHALNDFSEGFAAAQVDEKWGFIDKQGKWVVQPTLLELDDFSNGLARASKDGTSGYIDTTGKWVIAPQFHSVARFSPTTAVAYDADYNHFLIDRTGRVIKRFPREVRLNNDISRRGLIEATYSPPDMLLNVDGRRLPFPQGAEGYQDGLFIATAKVKRGDSEVAVYGLKDPAGKWVLPASFTRLEKFEGKLAIAAPFVADSKAATLHGLIDRKGKFVVKPVYKHLSSRGGGVYLASKDGNGAVTEVLDARGKPLFTYDCDGIGNGETHGMLTVLSGCGKTWLVHRDRGLAGTYKGELQVEIAGGLMMLKNDFSDDSDERMFEMYNEAGKRVAGSDPRDKFFSAHFDHIGLMPATGGALPLAIFGNFRSNLTGFLNRDFKLVTRPDWEYDSVLLHYSGSSGEKAEGPLVMKGPQGFGAVDMQGNWVVAPKYEELTPFEHGLAFATLDDGSRVAVDAAGKTYALPDGLRRLRRSAPLQLTALAEQGTVGIDLRTGKLTPLGDAADDEPDNVGETAGGLTPAEKDGQWGLVNAAKLWVLAPSLAAQPKPLKHKERLLGWTSGEGPVGLLDPQGRELLKPEYSALAVDQESGLIIAQRDGYLHSVLSTAGKTLMPPIDGEYKGLGDGWFKAGMKDLHGLLDERGEWVVKPGRVEYQLDTPYYLDPRPYTIVSADRLVDFKGRVSTRTQPLELDENEPSHWWWREDDEDEDQSVFYGFNFKQRVKLPGKASAHTFSEGVIAFSPSSPRKNATVGLADDKGKVIGLYPFADIGAMKGGMAMVSKQVSLAAPGKKRRGVELESVTRYGYLNRAGKLAVPVRFEQAADFSEKRATVLIDSGLAMIDDSGKILLQGAWQCGRTPVLMDSKRNVLWPEDARGVLSCKR